MKIFQQQKFPDLRYFFILYLASEFKCACSAAGMYNNIRYQLLYRSLPGKRPWALYHNSLISPYWTLTRCTGRLPCAKIEIGGANFV